MRIAVISVTSQRRQIPQYVKSMAKGMESQGHRVDIVDAWTEDGYRLPGYEYIAIAAESISFFSGKIPDVISKMLSAGSSLGGKKSAAFVKKTGLFSNRALTNLMKAMEKEGMMINWSDLLLTPAQAEALGKRIGS